MLLHPTSLPGPGPLGTLGDEARRFVDELGRLKGTYVKIGQMMALFGEHFLPPVLAEALHGLGDQTEPLPWESVEPVLRDSLAAEGMDVRTRAGDIDTVQSMERNLTAVFWTIAVIGLLGFSFSLGASLWANVDRKRRELRSAGEKDSHRDRSFRDRQERQSRRRNRWRHPRNSGFSATSGCHK